MSSVIRISTFPTWQVGSPWHSAALEGRVTGSTFRCFDSKNQVLWPWGLWCLLFELFSRKTWIQLIPKLSQWKFRSYASAFRHLTGLPGIRGHSSGRKICGANNGMLWTPEQGDIGAGEGADCRNECLKPMWRAGATPFSVKANVVQRHISNGVLISQAGGVSAFNPPCAWMWSHLSLTTISLSCNTLLPTLSLVSVGLWLCAPRFAFQTLHPNPTWAANEAGKIRTVWAQEIARSVDSIISYVICRYVNVICIHICIFT